MKKKQGNKFGIVDVDENLLLGSTDKTFISPGHMEATCWHREDSREACRSWKTRKRAFEVAVGIKDTLSTTLTETGILDRQQDVFRAISRKQRLAMPAQTKKRHLIFRIGLFLSPIVITYCESGNSPMYMGLIFMRTMFSPL